MNRLRAAACGIALLLCATGTAGQEAFHKNEFAGRRARLFEQVGGGVAVVFGADRNDAAPVKFRQAPDFFYLTGIEEPGLVLVARAGGDEHRHLRPRLPLVVGPVDHLGLGQAQVRGDDVLVDRLRR